jgi:hypothetical protein
VSSYASISHGMSSCRYLRADLSMPKARYPNSVSTLKSAYSGIWSLANMESKGIIPNAPTCSTSHLEINMKSICLDPCLCVRGASSC